MAGPTDPNGLTVALSEGGSVTIAPGAGNVGVQMAIVGAPGAAPSSQRQTMTLAEATTLYTLLGNVITNVTPA